MAFKCTICGGSEESVEPTQRFSVDGKEQCFDCIMTGADHVMKQAREAISAVRVNPEVKSILEAL